jgi:hypothetical protein
MAVYTVHQPPLRQGETSPDPDRFVLVRDGFYVWAFLLGPLWMAWRRLWLVLVLYIAAMICLGIGLRFAGATTAMQTLVLFAVAMLLGLEAATLRRWTLGRRRWKNIGVVVGDDPESAERRFFVNWIDGDQLRPLPRHDAMQPRAAAPRLPKGSSTDIIGLFPEADKSR